MNEHLRNDSAARAHGDVPYSWQSSILHAQRERMMEEDMRFIREIKTDGPSPASLVRILLKKIDRDYAEQCAVPQRNQSTQTSPPRTLMPPPTSKPPNVTSPPTRAIRPKSSEPLPSISEIDTPSAVPPKRGKSEPGSSISPSLPAPSPRPAMSPQHIHVISTTSPPQLPAPAPTLPPTRSNPRVDISDNLPRDDLALLLQAVNTLEQEDTRRTSPHNSYTSQPGTVNGSNGTNTTNTSGSSGGASGSSEGRSGGGSGGSSGGSSEGTGQPRPVQAADTDSQDSQFACSFERCPETFSSHTDLTAHLRTHMVDKPYKCPYSGCDRAFAQSGGLVRHCRTHTGDKPYRCEFPKCDKAFTEAGHLTRHTRSHTGEKPYECPYDCGKTFTTSYHLIRHTRVHTGEKPFTCAFPGCSKSFTQSGGLNRHARTHGDFPGGPGPVRKRGQQARINGDSKANGSQVSSMGSRSEADGAGGNGLRWNRERPVVMKRGSGEDEEDDEEFDEEDEEEYEDMDEDEEEEEDE